MRAERFQQTLLFDPKDRTIRNGAGKKLKPISYDSNVPVWVMV